LKSLDGGLLSSGLLSGSFLGSSNGNLWLLCNWSWCWSFLFGALALAITGWTGWARWTGWALDTFTPSNATVNNLQKKVVETILIKAGALHFILNFLAKRFHCIIYKREIIFKPNDHRWGASQ
jgi:hypothetical protein